MKSIKEYITTMDKKFKCLIIYHREDNDGLFSQAILTYYLNNVFDKPNIDYLGADYVMLSTITKEDIDKWNEMYDNVTLTDISFNDTKIFAYLIKTLGDKFTWIDHHAPIIKWANDHGYDGINGLRDTHHSALYNMFKYLYDPINIGEAQMPELYKILSAYDSFTFKENGYDKDYVMKINKGVEAQTELDRNKTLEIVKNVMTNDNETISIYDFLETGNIILNNDIRLYKSMCEQCDTDWYVDKDKAAVLFCEGQSSSIMFNYFINTDIKRGIVFHHKKNDSWTMSLYNVNDNDNTFNCGTYLKENYNGGGHVGAAGCTITNAKFIQMLKNKSV